MLRSRDKAQATDAVPERADAWRMLFVPSVLFVVVGSMDAVLTWFPTNFGSAEWEFGTISASLNGLPLPVLGLVLMLAGSLALGRRRLAWSVVMVLLLIAIVVAIVAVLYLLTLPQAFRAAADAGEVGRIGIRKAMLKSVVQLIGYPVALGITAWYGWRTLRSST